MHPAYSVIVFTTSSGAGYGLLFWLSLVHGFALLPESRWFAFVALFVALLLISVGLIASTLHLGHPERAIGAFSQWRSSWLSREGVAAVATYIPAGLLALIWLFGADTGFSHLLAWLCVIGAAATVYCTGMIYASLRTIRQWHLSLVPGVYLALAAATGALLYGTLLALFGHAPAWVGVLALLSLGIGAWLKLHYWKRIDADAGRYTIGSATGLERFGKVRTLDPPHTRPNFVMREMGYSVARNHALKLRRIALVCLFVIPAACVLLGLLSNLAGLFFLLAAVSAATGVVIERWLFFAEAEHVSQLYYGAQRA